MATRGGCKMYPIPEHPLLKSALDKALRITGQSLGNIQLIDWEAGCMEIAAQRGFSSEFLDCFRRVTTRDDCACGRALLARTRIIIDNVAGDRRFSPFLGVAERAGFKAVQSTPLVSSSGALVGVISTHGGHSPTNEQLGQISSLAFETANELIRWRAHFERDGVRRDGMKIT